MNDQEARLKGWRYQPVYFVTNRHGVEDVYVSLVEVYLNADDTLSSWTTEPAAEALGNDPDDLRLSLCHMLVDAYCWKPVNYADLKVGIKFEGVPMQARLALADFVGQLGERLANLPSSASETATNQHTPTAPASSPSQPPAGLSPHTNTSSSPRVSGSTDTPEESVR